MVDDPYKVLGIPKDASKEDIKKAYRKKAKEWHPDMHQGDPQAVEKMNEINEAYDMLNHPEKYQNRQRDRAGGGYQSYGNPYGQNRENQSYGNQWNQNQWEQRTYRGGYGSFDDFFGYGWANTETPKPNIEPGDSMEIRQVIGYINKGQYGAANQILNMMVSHNRNARWYYLSALANDGVGNRIRASEQIQRAVQMEPANPVYQKTMQAMSRHANTYGENSQEFQKYAQSMNNLCMGLCAMQFCCMFCH